MFDIKRKPEDKITRYEAKWVAQSFCQMKKIDFFESYSGVVKSMLWKKILFLCIRYDYKVHHVEVISAYLKAELKQEIWTQQFHDFESDDSSQTCLLKKAIYSLKQSARMWYKTLKEFLTNQDFVKIRSDYSVFIHMSPSIIRFWFTTGLCIFILFLLLFFSEGNQKPETKKTLQMQMRVEKEEIKNDRKKNNISTQSKPKQLIWRKEKKKLNWVANFLWFFFLGGFSAKKETKKQNKKKIFCRFLVLFCFILYITWNYWIQKNMKDWKIEKLDK